MATQTTDQQNALKDAMARAKQVGPIFLFLKANMSLVQF